MRFDRFPRALHFPAGGWPRALYGGRACANRTGEIEATPGPRVELLLPVGVFIVAAHTADDGAAAGAGRSAYVEVSEARVAEVTLTVDEP